jgi:superfamily II helicase
MGILNVNDVVGLRLQDEIVCRRCLTSEERSEFTEDEAITQDETGGDDIYFCDRCKKRF